LSNCPRCSAHASFHKRDARLRCHHCGWQTRVPRACPTCGNQDLLAVGQGTQRIEEALHDALPQTRIGRIDRDITSRRHAVREALDAMHAGDIDVLVGTQMIAKGHDFRRVALVGVLNADSQLLASDFRAPEHLFATLLQVIGRAGRSGQPARVLLQTRRPEHPLYAALARQDFPRFARDQLAERRAMRLPPFVHAALLTAIAPAMETALRLLQAARETGLALAADGPVRLYEAVPMPLERLAGEHRAQLLVEADRRPDLHAFLDPWLEQVRRRVAADKIRARWGLEVDPLAI
jgi:primosomal protein N' (replication factor Y)